jgi:two-component sensor histidine kinase
VQLVQNLCRLHEDQSGKVELEFAVDEIDLSPDLAVPVGLILNEFVTNSLKYAFGGRGGVIKVVVQILERGGLNLRISDNGKGLPSERQAAKPGSGTGMKLIEALARQLGAKPMWLPNEPGTALNLQFERY